MSGISPAVLQQYIDNWSQLGRDYWFTDLLDWESALADLRMALLNSRHVLGLTILFQEYRMRTVSSTFAVELGCKPPRKP